MNRPLNLNIFHPGNLNADIFNGTINLPMGIAPENPASVKTYSLGMTEDEFSSPIEPPRVMVNERSVSYREVDRIRYVDARELAGDDALSWQSTFNNDATRKVYPGWRLNKEAFRASLYPERRKQEFIDDGHSPEKVEKYYYVANATLVHVAEGVNKQVISELDLDKDRGTLRVAENGIAVKMVFDGERVVQENFSVLMGQVGFLRYFDFNIRMKPVEQLKKAAMAMFQDQFSELSYLMSDVDINLFGGSEEILGKLGEEEFFEGLIAQAQAVATIAGQKQVLVKVNAIYAGDNGLVFEIIVNRPELERMLIGDMAKLAHQSFPVRGNLREYLGGHYGHEQMQQLRVGNPTEMTAHFIPNVSNEVF